MQHDEGEAPTCIQSCHHLLSNFVLKIPVTDRTSSHLYTSTLVPKLALLMLLRRQPMCSVALFFSGRMGLGYLTDVIGPYADQPS